jgi:hypothetical protein
MAKSKTSEPTKSQKRQLRSALRANGISPNYEDWKDTQGLGSAIREALRAG